MRTKRQLVKLPAFLSAGSFILLMMLMANTNPLDNAIYTVIFFVISAVMLISLGYVLTYLRWGQVVAKSRYRIIIVTSVILIALMLRSSGSLNLIEASVLVFIGVGLWFYSGRRLSS